MELQCRTMTVVPHPNHTKGDHVHTKGHEVTIVRTHDSAPPRTALPPQVGLPAALASMRASRRWGTFQSAPWLMPDEVAPVKKGLVPPPMLANSVRQVGFDRARSCHAVPPHAC